MAQINHDTVRLWESWQRRELRFDRCEACGTWIHPPRPFCPDCWSDRVAQAPVDGAGRLLSYSLPRVPPGAPPVVSGVVTLDGADGVRLLAQIVDCPPERVALGMPVTIDWREEDGTVYPQFRPTATAGGSSGGSGAADSGAAGSGASDGERGA